MATQETRTQHTLEIHRTLEAAPEAVFRAWTEAAALTKWFGPSPDFGTKVLALDVRKGGRYRIAMEHPDGSSHIATGEYREVQAPSKLVFTWQWETNENPEETTVTVELRGVGAATELTLRHERFSDAESKNKHNEGWMGCLSRLDGAL